MKRKTGRLIIQILVFFMTTFYFSAYAQKEYEEGFVVLNSNDTLYGKIRDRKTGAFGKLYKKIKFKGKSGKSRYAPREIVAYSIGQSLFESLPLVSSGSFFDDEYFVSPEGDFQFLKVVAKGHLSYYLMEFEDPDSGHIDTIAYFKKKSGSNLVRVNQGIFGLKRKKLATFFSDCPELASKIRDKKIKNATEIVTFYNNWKQENP